MPWCSPQPPTPRCPTHANAHGHAQTRRGQVGKVCGLHRLHPPHPASDSGLSSPQRRDDPGMEQVHVCPPP